MKRGQEIDPSSLIINTNVGWMSYLEGRYDEAIEAYDKDDRDRPEVWAAWACELRGE